MPNVLLTFDDLDAGDIVGDQYSSQGVSISTLGWKPPMIFDTDNPTGGDWDLATNNLGNVLIISEDGDSNDPDDNAGGGTFVFDFDDPSEVINFNVLDNEEGGWVKCYDEDGNLIKTVQMPTTSNNGQATVNINCDGVAKMEVTLCGSGAIDNLCYCPPEDPAQEPQLDGYVEGTNGADVIDVNYTGDPEGDMIDNGDAILPGEGPDDDIVLAFGGDDEVRAGKGDDEVYAGSGNDTVHGNDGNDIIYGDSNLDGAGGAGARESFEWSKAPGFDDGDDANGFTQNTGSVNVTFSIIRENGDVDTEWADNSQNVSDIDSGGETVNDNSSLSSVLNGNGNDGDYKLTFDSPVENVSFRVNDIDGDGKVKIKAFDANGNPIVINLTGGDKLTMLDTDGVAGADTADSQGGYQPDTSDDYSLLVEIPGPVSEIKIFHDQNGGNNSGVNITDVFFDVPVIDNGAPGNDILYGGDGEDIIYGEGGNDEIYGGEGADELYGGDGDDTIYGQGDDDIMDGGDGNDTIIGGRDNDTIMGGDGNDYIDGFSGDDMIDGGEGDDTIIGGGGDDTLLGGGGNDNIQGGNNVDYIDGGDGDDTITAGHRDDTVYGGDGNDTVYGEEGDDFIDTSAPLSSIPLPDRGYPGLFPADSDPYNDKDFVDGGDGDDTIITGDDDDVIIGGEGNDTIDAGFDDDTVDGGDGDDFIVGGEGSDTIDGGDGNDTIYGGLDPIFPDELNIPDDIDLVPDNGKDVIHGGAGDDTIYGQDDDDEIYGDEGDDTIDAGIDDDYVEGGDGNDTITGGEGEDVLIGGADRDTFLGGNGGDHVDGSGTGDDFDTLDLTGSDVDFITYTSADREDGIVTFLDGSTMTFEEIENVIPCFTPGTMVATPTGEVAVETLQPGDKVITRDNGIQEIRWFGAKSLDWAHLAANEHLKPVLIRAGALGNGLPERDMMVSPNHRMLVANDRTSLYFEEREVLVAAKHLVNNRGVSRADALGTTYIHFMFDRHEVVLANGSWTESFQPGDYTLDGIGNAQRNEIFELFPELKTREGVDAYTAARKSLKKHEALLLVD